VDIRRFCGYPAVYTSAVPTQPIGFLQALGTLDGRLNNLSDVEVTVVRGLLTTLRRFELAVAATSDSLDTNQAATWTRNQSEIDDRLRLLGVWQRKLCAFLGVAPGRGVTGTTTFLVV
jgi:hypothetical protein